MKSSFAAVVFAVAVALCLLCSGSVHAASQGTFQSFEEFGEWTSDYYRAPSPERLDIATDYLFEEKVFDDNPGLYWPLASFFGGCYATDEEAAARAVDHALGSSDPYLQTFVLSSLWYADTDHCRAEISRAADQLEDPRMKGLIDHVLKTPPPLADEELVVEDVHLDMLWGRFQATGESAPVHRVIDAIAGLDHNDQRLLVANSAKWSLGSQARNHPAVLAVVRERAETEEDGSVRDALREILAEIDAEAEDEPDQPEP